MNNRSIKLLISIFMVIALLIVTASFYTRYTSGQDDSPDQTAGQTQQNSSVQGQNKDDDGQVIMSKPHDSENGEDSQETEHTEPTTALHQVQLPVSMYDPPPEMPDIGTGLKRWPEVLSIPVVRKPDLDVYRNVTGENPLEGITIILDPGHGGQDGGAQYPIGVASPDYVEKEIVLEVSLLIRDYLEEMGATVLMLREEDIWLSIYARIALTSQYLLDDFMSLLPYHGYKPDALAHIRPQLEEMIEINSDFASSGGRGPMLGIGTNDDMRLLMDVLAQYPDVLFISVHCNALEDLSVGGLQVFYQTGEHAYQQEHSSVMYQDPDNNPPAYSMYPDEDRLRLAQLVRDHILEKIPELKFRGESDLLEANFALLREMNMTSILLEMGFITNERDRGIIMSRQGQEKIARGVADAVYAYYTS